MFIKKKERERKGDFVIFMILGYHSRRKCLENY